MKIQWTSHLQTDEEKENFKRQVLGSKSVLERIITLVDERLKVSDAIETSVEKYKQPGWDAIQAHYNGAKAELKWIKNLITLDQEDTRNDRKLI